MNAFSGSDVNYRAWVGIIEENLNKPQDTPGKFKASHPAHNFYANREWATECSLGVNEAEIEKPLGIWSVVFRKGEEPIAGQNVQIASIASFN